MSDSKGGCMDSVELAAEDILRFLRERGGKARLEDVVGDVGEYDVARRALERLAERNLVRVGEGVVELSRAGWEAAEKVYRRHIAAEQVLKELVGDAHKAAHSIEHVELRPDMLKDALRGRICSLSKLPVGSEARMIAVLDPRPSLLSRLYGVGLVPGRRLRIVAKPRGSVVVEVGTEARIVAVDEDVARKILAVMGAAGF